MFGKEGFNNTMWLYCMKENVALSTVMLQLMQMTFNIKEHVATVTGSGKVLSTISYKTFQILEGACNLPPRVETIK